MGFGLCPDGPALRRTVRFFFNKPGTGLGLAIAQQIVQAHDGLIDVRSTVGEGSVFEVRLPVVKPDDLTVMESLQ